MTLLIIAMLKINPIPTLYLNIGESAEIRLSPYILSTSKISISSVKILGKDTKNFEIFNVEDRIFLRPAKKIKGILFLSFEVKNVEGEIAKGVVPIVYREEHKVKFIYHGKPGEEVYLAGEFNNWNPKSLKMEDKGGGIYVVELSLPPGRYQYKFVVNGNWIRDEKNPLTAPDGFGGLNSVIEVKGKEFNIIPDKLKKEENKISFSVEFEGKIKDVYLVMDNKVLPKCWKIKGKKITFEVKNVEKGEHWFRLFVGDGDNFSELFFKEYIGIPTKFDWRDAIIYYIVVDRFCNGDKENDKPINDPELPWKCNFQGGDFEGIIQKLKEGYFNKLGINCIWLSPVYKAPDKAYKESFPPYRKYSGYHGYWPVSPTEVEPRFGGAKKLKELINLAHKKGIKIMFDLVLNHVHIEHPWYKNHKDWFTPLYLPDGRKNLRLFDEFPLTTWFDEFVPSFDFSKKEVIDTVCENAIWWLREFDVDAVRLDAVKHIPHSFWREFRRRIKEEIEITYNKEIYLLGETIWSREKIKEYVNPEELTGQFDYPLYWVIRDVFAFNRRDFRELEHELLQSERIYGDAIMSPFLGNQDFARFISYIEGLSGDEKEIGWHNPPEVKDTLSYKKLQLAFAFLMTLKGAPLIFYGDEIGMPGAGDPDNRRFMRFGDKLKKEEKETFEVISKLCHFRRKHPALRYGVRRTLYIDDDFWVYELKYFNDDVLVLLNRGRDEREYELKGDWLNEFTGEKISSKVKVSPFSFVYLTKINNDKLDFQK